MKFFNTFIARSACLLVVSTVLTPGAFSAETAVDQPLVIEQSGPGHDQTALYFERDGHPEVVFRYTYDLLKATRSDLSTTETRGRSIVQALVEGPDEAEKAAGYTSFLPDGVKLGKIETNVPGEIRIYLDIPADFIKSERYSQFVENTGRHFRESLIDVGFSQFLFFVKDWETGEYHPIRHFLPAQEPVSLPEMFVNPDADVVVPTAETSPRSLPTQNGFVAGALAGKSVVLNQSHGWYDNNTSLNRWAIERTLTWEVLEDYASGMFINHYVIPMLQNAGARPRPVREPDSQTNMVIVDNAFGAPRYVESGPGWTSSDAKGFVYKATYSGLLDNPFGEANSTRYTTGVTGAPTAQAQYTAAIPAAGYYNVYVSYSQGSNRSTNAHWQVHHSGGITDFRLNQRMGGGTWILLGNFYFEGGADQAKVVVLNDTGDNAIVSCDAIRIGGGMGNIARRNHGVSGRPRWQETVNNYLQFNGMLNSTLMSNDSSGLTEVSLGITNRPQYAQWEQVRDGLGNNLVYVGWHTNASGWVCNNGVEVSGAGRGTLSIRDVDADATAGTENLTEKLHTAMVASLRASYNGAWPTRGANNGISGSNDYGEANQANLGSVAGFFFEGLFHDNTTDAAAYKDPKWRYAAARGIVNGLIQYYGGTVFPPEPVSNFQVKNLGAGQVQLRWTPGQVGNTTTRIGSAATGYRIYKSSNGFGFDNGTDVANVTQYVAALTPGETTFFRIAAVNSSGISVPSETLAAQVPTAGHPTVVIVNGYQRNDRFLSPILFSSNIGGCTPPLSNYRTMDPREFQSYNYTVQHALAIAAKGGFGIDSCSKDAINLGNVNLADYPMVFWIGGQEGEADTADNVDDTAFSINERNAIAGYLAGGGNLFISGSELAWDFGRPAATADKKDFLSNNLKATFTSDGSNTYNASGTAGIFAGLGSFAYDNGNGNTYQVRFPDVLTPVGGATACLSYSGGTGGTAGIQYSGLFGAGTQGGKLVYLGFGFETISSETVRNAMMDRVITFFTPSNVSDWKSF